jgi:hypothetical protein
MILRAGAVARNVVIPESDFEVPAGPYRPR